MKKILPFFILSLFFQTSFSQNFTWMKGPNTNGNIANYGTQGVSAPSNNPGGRHGCGKWVDLNGNLWLFGGEGYSTSSVVKWMNDLWKYNPITNEWTWVRGSNGPNPIGSYGTIGVSSPSNDPPGREFAACWTDASGNFWMYGGDGSVSSPTVTSPEKLGDLWKYNPSTNEWTWIKGYNIAGQSGVYGTLGVAAPANMPGGRMGAGVWTDAAGDLWLFGGLGFPAGPNQGYLNDLWKYNISSNQWAWMGGTNLTGQYGAYGTMGVPSTTNMPGGRFLPGSFRDASGNLYLFGGRGFAASTIDYMNDLWKFEPSNGNWTWIHGLSSINNAGIYGTLGVASASTCPGSRHSTAGWVDASGNYWMFGGHGFAATTSTIGNLNDLFRYNPGTNQWAWMKGATLNDQNGNYGTIGVTAPTNNPGSREYNTWWKSPNGDLWLFGGEGMDGSNTTTDHLSDLWKYHTPCNPDSVTAVPGKTVCSGQSLTLTAINAGSVTTWFTSPTSTTSIGSGDTYTSPVLSSTTGATVFDYYAESQFCTAVPRASISITVLALPTLTAVSEKTLICKGNSSTLTVSGANSYTWNTTPVKTSTSIIVTPINTATYIVTGMDINGCKSTTNVVQQVNPCLGINENTSIEAKARLYPNPGNGQFVIVVPQSQKNEEVIIMNAIGQKVYSGQLNEIENNIKTDLNKGLYFYQVIRKEEVLGGGKLIVQ